MARIWLGWLDSNQRMPESKSGALPLGDTPTSFFISNYHLAIIQQLGCGGWIRTNDLRVMSPTSYHCSTPRCRCLKHDVSKQNNLYDTLSYRLLSFDLILAFEMVGRDGFEPSYLSEQIYSLSPLTARPPTHNYTKYGDPDRT